MALYRVSRTDTVNPGEFDHAYVIAGGTAQARKAVRSFYGVTASNVTASRVDLTSTIEVISSHFTESDDVVPTPSHFLVGDGEIPARILPPAESYEGVDYLLQGRNAQTPFPDAFQAG